MNEKQVSYLVFESALARMERTIKRLWVLAIILVGLLLATNIGWLWYESQFEEIVVEQLADASGGGNAITNVSGEVDFNGEGIPEG